MVEFCLPHDINLDGVEFKSMASGSHRITNDFMYVLPPSEDLDQSVDTVRNLLLSVYSSIFV